MITKTQLRKEHDNRFNGRPQRIQALRDAISTYTGLEVPRSAADVEEWYDEHYDEISEALEPDDDDGAETEGEGGDA
jgi:hypothetical protein